MKKMFNSFFSFLSLAVSTRREREVIPKESAETIHVVAINEAGEEIILEYQHPLFSK